jgi:hypothetical protein
MYPNSQNLFEIKVPISRAPTKRDLQRMNRDFRRWLKKKYGVTTTDENLVRFEPIHKGSPLKERRFMN